MGQLAPALAELARSLSVATKPLQHALDDQQISFESDIAPTRTVAWRACSSQEMVAGMSPCMPARMASEPSTSAR